MATSARIILATILFAGSVIVALPWSDALAQSSGVNALFIGHSFFRPFAQGMPFHAAQAGIVGHTQTLVIAGGGNGAPQALWENPTRRAEIQAVLDGGDVELFGMTYHGDYPTTEGYENWIDYALAQNPNTRIMLALPWGGYPESSSAAVYASTWLAGHAAGWHNLVDYLRGLYPGVEIFCNPYGQSSLELRLLFEAGNLPDVNFLIGAANDAIYIDTLGHAGDILVELGRLVWLNAIYDVDLTTYAYDPGYIADLKGIAQSIMDAHDAPCGSGGPCCGYQPLTGCKGSLAGKSQLQINLKASEPSKNQLKFNYKGGVASVLTEFGDPAGASSLYALCVWDGSVNPQPLIEMQIEAGGQCNGKPCWKTRTGRSHQYKNKGGNDDGVEKVKIKADGTPDKSAIQVKAKGAAFAAPTLPLFFPPTAQFLVIDGGTACWEVPLSVYIKNAPGGFKAKGP